MPSQPLSDLTKVRAGEPVRGFSAKWYNDVIDMLTWYRRQRQSSGSGGASGPSRDGDVIEVRNDCGADRQTGEVLAIGGPIFSQSDNAADYQANNLLYSGTQPTTDSAGKWCLLLEPIANGQIGTAAVAGQWPAQVNFTNADDTWAEVAAGSYNLLSNPVSGSGQILSNDGDGTGVQWAIVRWPFPPSNLVPFRNNNSAAVPTNGVICAYLTAYPSNCPGFGDAQNVNWPRWGTQFPGICALRLNYYQSNLMGWAGGYYISASPSVASHASGLCSAATDQPTMALFSPDTGAGTVTPLPGEIWGPAPGTFTLYRGLPGFQVVGPVDTVNHLVGVIAAPQATCWCVAKEAWHYGVSFLPRYDRQCWVTCYPTTGPSGGQYDGSSRSPHIELLLNLRRGTLYKDPNIVAGNTLVYRATMPSTAPWAGAAAAGPTSSRPAATTSMSRLAPSSPLPPPFPRGSRVGAS